MLGRLRSSPIDSLQLLNVERNSSKIIKHDSLSIYESTLLKLKQGSHLNPTSTFEDSSMVDAHGSADADGSSTDSLSNSCNVSQSTDSKKNQTVNTSIHQMFSRYTSSKLAENWIEFQVGEGVSSSSLDRPLSH